MRSNFSLKKLVLVIVNETLTILPLRTKSSQGVKTIEDALESARKISEREVQQNSTFEIQIY